jgi:hypothetical protein
MAIVHGEGTRPDVSFYAVEKKGVVLVNKLEKKAVNALFWCVVCVCVRACVRVNATCVCVHRSPRGRHIVLAGLRNLNGQLEVCDMSRTISRTHAVLQRRRKRVDGLRRALHVHHCRLGPERCVPCCDRVECAIACG